MITEYDELRIRFERRDGSYQVFATGVGGEVSEEFTLPFSDIELENIVLRLGASRRGIRRVNSPEMKLAEEFGRKLFDALFRDRTRDLYRSCSTRAKASEKGLRLTLCLSDTPELMHLPWEYLYDDPDFLSTREETPVVRHLNLPSAARPLRIDLPLRILAMVSAPRDAVGLDVAQERRNLEQAVEELTRVDAVEITWLEQATLLALLDKLQVGAYHVFHYIGHGGYDQQADDGVLLLEDENGLGHRVTGGRLATILGNHSSLRLAVLNACEGARTSRTDPFAGVAASLVQREVPAVIAMQFEITDRAAILFAGQFYKALARGYAVDAALAWARLAIFADQNDIEWGTPVLIMRAANGRIFDVPKPLEGKGVGLEPPAPPPPPDPAPVPDPAPDPPPPESTRSAWSRNRRVLVGAGAVVAAALAAILAALLWPRGESPPPAIAGLDWSSVRVTSSRLPGRRELFDVVRLRQSLVTVGFDRRYDRTRRVFTWQPLVLSRDEQGRWRREEIALGPTGGQQWLNGLAVTTDALIAVGWSSPPGTGVGGRDAAVWRSTSGGSWTRVCMDEAVCGDDHPGGGRAAQGMWAVAARKQDRSFVAVGYDVRGGRFDAAVWRSSDGEEWRRVDSDTFGGDRNQQMRAVIETDDGLVAVGGDGDDGAVWTSADGGETWLKASAPPTCRECDSMILYDVAELKGDLIAVGASTKGARDRAALWRHHDGAWSEIQTDAHADVGQRLLGVAAGKAGVVVVGYEREGGKQLALVWRSADGIQWQREEPATPGAEVNAVAVDPQGTAVATGDILAARPADNPFDRADADGAVWIGVLKGGGG